jgi:hypothetical protein
LTITRSLQHLANDVLTRSEIQPTTTAAATPTDGACRRVVCLPDYYADSPQAWFCCIDAMFAASRITVSLTEFNWALSKLLFSLIDSIGPLCKHLSS